jgi:hypothetical protein
MGSVREVVMDFVARRHDVALLMRRWKLFGIADTGYAFGQLAVYCRQSRRSIVLGWNAGRFSLTEK